jgi:hypothetical protein
MLIAGSMNSRQNRGRAEHGALSEIAFLRNVMPSSIFGMAGLRYAALNPNWQQQKSPFRNQPEPLRTL